jgi:hypothetical protein
MTEDNEIVGTALVQSQVNGIDKPEWLQPYHEQAAYLLALGKSKTDVAKEVKVTRPALYTWLKREDFARYVDQLTMTVGLANKAERVRLLKQRAKELWDREKDKPSRKHDWLDYSQAIAEETGAYQLGHNVLAQQLVKVFGDVNISVNQAKALSDDVIEGEYEEAPG